MSIELRIPSAGESIQEVQIGQWLKHEGDTVRRDETLVELDTDKASMELPSPSDGVLSRIVKQDGDKVAVGEVIAYIEPQLETSEKPQSQPPQATKTGKSEPGPSAAKSTPVPAPPKAKSTPAPKTSRADIARTADEPVAAPSVRRLLREHHVRAEDVKPTGEGGRVLREDVLKYAEEHAGDGKQPDGREQTTEGTNDETVLRPAPPPPATKPTPGPVQAEPSRPSEKASDVAVSSADATDRADEIVPMSLLRRRIAERLVEARQKTALLTTFNEIDMTAVIGLRTQYREAFQEKYGVKLGFASFFVQASVAALRQFPVVNAEIRGTDIVYHNAYHIGMAIGAERGLVVPVIRDADRMSLAEIEQAIHDFSARAKSNKLQPGELSGGTFTISNGGIFGSLLSTPIVNPPQSAVLGMHAIQDRPVARDGQVVIRPMMYVALSYDHRLIDGREAVTFLTRIKQTIEEPARLVLGI
jgi:2-oxoglutarate dehydrogenase E2 component (dihydrolipoamide succinyltransferase)